MDKELLNFEDIKTTVRNVIVFHVSIERTGESFKNLVSTVKVPNTMTDIEALEYAFEKTNNFEGSWSQGPKIGSEGKIRENLDYSENITVKTKVTTSLYCTA